MTAHQVAWCVERIINDDTYLVTSSLKSKAPFSGQFGPAIRTPMPKPILKPNQVFPPVVDDVIPPTKRVSATLRALQAPPGCGFQRGARKGLTKGVAKVRKMNLFRKKVRFEPGVAPAPARAEGTSGLWLRWKAWSKVAPG